MLKRAAFYIVGLFILGLGISFTIKAEVGTGAWDALNVGLTKLIGFTVGTWLMVIGLLLIFINAFISQEKPKFSSMLTPILIGFTVDFWMLFGLIHFHVDGLFFQYIWFFIGVVLIAVGVAMYLQADFAPNPIDNFMISLHKRFGLNLMTAKTIGEVFAFVLALLLQGPIGIGTIIITIIIGPIIQFFYKPIQNLYKKWKFV